MKVEYGIMSYIIDDVVKYVHELQHILWAMGKDSTMIV